MSPILGIYASQISGHLWAPSGAYDAIASTTLSTATASITFSGIPSTYTHLQLRLNSKSNRATYVDDFGIQFNGDTGSNYSYHRLYGFGSGTPGADSGVTQTSMNIGQWAGGTVNNALGFGGAIIDILDYQNNYKYKTAKCLSGYDDNGQGAMQFASGNYRSLNTISSITLFPLIGTTINAYSTFALYGIR